MAEYYFTNKAVDDLSEIWDYPIETWSEMQAEIMIYFWHHVII